MPPSSSVGLTIDESTTDLFMNDISLLSSTSISGMAYGIMITLYSLCVYSLYQTLPSSKLDRSRWRRTWYQLAYISIMFLLGTLFAVANAWRALLPYFDDPSLLGSPTGYTDSLWSDSISRMGTASFIISNWMGDGLVVSFLCYCFQ
ncbi:hypothetical protein BV22DRAFT_1041483 [Leucogyrophana mollusca]|uniref:Uncharacterized protein n=1 Tax=Leucogyrophana mollusca TaxID=85980 RepID=A0ACB8B135_9AGAM|nr:hypothetical protein BV22DRAFT_1041483 [Leucogyrophana mollusca]